MGLKSQIFNLFKQNLGVFSGVPRCQRVVDLALVYAYITRGLSASSSWQAENVLSGAASSDVVLQEGDLLLDRALGKYFYIVGLTPGLVDGEAVRYDFKAYVCNEVLVWQRLTEGPRVAFTHQPEPSSYQTIQPVVHALLTLDKPAVDGATFSEEDASSYTVYHNYAAAKEGDRLITSRGKELIVKLSESVTYQGALVKSLCVGGSGG